MEEDTKLPKTSCYIDSIGECSLNKSTGCFRLYIYRCMGKISNIKTEFWHYNGGYDSLTIVVNDTELILSFSKKNGSQIKIKVTREQDKYHLFIEREWQHRLRTVIDKVYSIESLNTALCSNKWKLIIEQSIGTVKTNLPELYNSMVYRFPFVGQVFNEEPGRDSIRPMVQPGGSNHTGGYLRKAKSKKIVLVKK